MEIINGKALVSIMKTIKMLVLAFVFCIISDGASWGGASKIGKLTISIRNGTLEQICEEISRQINYEVIFDGPMIGQRMSIDIRGLSLERSVDSILKNAGVNNYSIIRDYKDQKVIIKYFSVAYKTELNKDTEQVKHTKLVSKRTNELLPAELSNKDIEAEVKIYKNRIQDLSLSDEIESGITHRDMNRNEMIYKERITSMPLDSEIESGITHRDMKREEKTYAAKVEKMSLDSEVLPGLTYKALENEIKKYQARIANVLN